MIMKSNQVWPIIFLVLAAFELCLIGFGNVTFTRLESGMWVGIAMVWAANTLILSNN